jgi:UDP-N-acetyl-D-mannosaminuronic acid transferase (WecB/TagA/CpsF family)
MKALLTIAAIAASAAVTASAALAGSQGYRYLGDTLSADVNLAPSKGINIITDTLGGSGQPRMAQGINIITDTLDGNGQPSTKPYIYGGAPPAVAQAGSGFYRAHLAHTPPVRSSGDGFNWSDAGLGAVTGFGALFLVAGTTILVRRRNNQQIAL